MVQINDRRLRAGQNAFACTATHGITRRAIAAAADPLEVCETHPDSHEHSEKVPGASSQMPPWESRIFNGTCATGGFTCRRNIGAENLRPHGLRTATDLKLGADCLRQSDCQERHARHVGVFIRAGRNQRREIIAV